MMVYPTKEVFLEKSKEGNLVPVWCEHAAHNETAVTAYEKVRTFLRDSNQVSHSYLLESAEGIGKIGRYSFIGGAPRAILRAYGNKVEIEDNHSKKTVYDIDPLEVLKSHMSQYKPVLDDKLESPFIGGAVGFIGYDMVSEFEPRVNRIKKDDLGAPDMVFMVTDGLIIFDRLKESIITLVHAHIKSDPEIAYERAIQELNNLELALETRIDIPTTIIPDKISSLEPRSNTTELEFFNMVDQVKEYIHAGDVIQTVISQRFEIDNDADSIDVYRALREINPSPYMFCLDMADSAIVGTSPEIHVRCQNRRVEVRPIAGTRPRGHTEEADKLFEKDLLADPKELAEHIMLVDLGRNDIGRVCKYNSVEVEDLMVIERYSHVMHIVSNVVGTLDKDCDIYDVMRASFPAGTVSGAPKVRAMEIISELEKSKRGPYAGAVGYFGFDGNFDSAITIRTVILDKDKAYVQAGAGIVADSTPESEYKETQNKARGMMKALALAQIFNSERKHKNK